MPNIFVKSMIVTGGIVSIVVAASLISSALRTPESVMADFYDADGRGEDQLTDPLVLAGKRVAPNVVAAIARPEMPRRRYAIAFLGCEHYQPALPQLRRILASTREEDYFRADALEAIWLINSEEGLVLASRYKASADYLGTVARQILAGTHEPICRSWWQAFTRQHG